MKKYMARGAWALFCFLLPFFFHSALFAANTGVSAGANEDADANTTRKQPVTVNGDVVEFKSEGREIVAEGHVEIVGQDMRMTADKVRVFFDEKIIIAEGNVTFKRGIQEMEGEMIVFDFGDKTGTLIDPHVDMAPYYGSALVADKLGEGETSLRDAVITTCDLPHPHYALNCKQVTTDKEKMLRAKGIKLSLLDCPVMYFPSYSHRLTDKRPRFMITPGYKKNYGMELFGMWRYYLNKNARGVLHFDWYQLKGWAQGVDLNYNNFFGEGDAKYYRIDEKDTSKNAPANAERKERKRIEVRHKWEMTKADEAVFQFFKSSDANFRKDYFYREYEKERDPLSFFLYSHAFPNATFSLLGQPRVNRWEGLLQKIPEVRLETYNQKIGDSKFYFKDTSSVSFLSYAWANSGLRRENFRTDTSNQLSYLFRWAGIDFGPYIGHQDTFYNRGEDRKDDILRGMFFSGIDMSLKLFKTFDIETDFLGLDIHKLRHVITPTINYRYQHRPTVPASQIQQLDSIDSLDRLSRATIGLENKLQTKRKDLDVDLARVLLSTDYYLKDNNSFELGFQLLDLVMELKPYSWGEIDIDSTYDLSKERFNTLDGELWGSMGKYWGHAGIRYAHGQKTEMSVGLKGPINPFWRFEVYERFETDSGNFVEQEYRFIRDMHCWLMEIIIDQRETEGVSIFVAFNLKAFPEIGINAEKTFPPPRSEEPML